MKRLLAGRSSIFLSAAALVLGIGAAFVFSRAGSSERVETFTAQAEESSPKGAHVGDGVCASSMKAYGDDVRAPGASDRPKSTKEEAIAVSRSEMVVSHRDDGAWDAYFALVDQNDFAPPEPDGRARRTGFLPTWVVELNGLDLPWMGGTPARPVGTVVATPPRIHHMVEFVRDGTLQRTTSVFCP